MGGAHSPPHRGGWRDSLIEAGAPGAKREPDRAKPQLMFGETLRRSDHPDCAASVASRHSFDGAATPPLRALRGGEYYATIITKYCTSPSCESRASCFTWFPPGFPCNE